MWLLVEDPVKECLVEALNLGRLEKFFDLSGYYGGIYSPDWLATSLSWPMANLAKKYSSRLMVLRFSDAIRHAQLAFGKEVDPWARLGILVEAFDILCGWEAFYVPSHKNSLALLEKIITLASAYPQAKLEIV